MTALEIAKKLNKAYKTDVLTDGSVLPRAQKVSMGSVAADYAVDGGIPLGTISIYAGQPGSGKTTAAVQTMAEYQRQYPDRTCIYVDAEQTLITQMDFFVKMTGLIIDDPNRFLRMDTSGRSAEEIFEDILQLEQSDNPGLIVIDSAPCLISAQDLGTDFTKDNGMRSSISKTLGKFCKNMVMYLPKKNNAMIIINQVRESKTFTGAIVYDEPCGYALKYYSSLKLRFSTRSYTLEDSADLSQSKAEEADGFRLKFVLTKSRLSRTKAGGFMTYRYETGRDVIGDTLEVALKYGYIEHPNNATYILVNLDTGEYYTDENNNILKFVGRAKLISYLNEHLDFQKEFVDMLSKHISSSNSKISLLDESTMNEILNQEASVENEDIKTAFNLDNQLNSIEHQ